MKLEKLKTMPFINNWTREKVINQVIKEFKGYSSNDYQCMYRDEKGRKCIAGCFIPDELYNESFENDSIEELIDNTSPEIYKSMPFPALTMKKWQRLHDYKLDDKMSLDAQLKILLEFLN